MEQTTTISLAEYNKLKRENQLMSAGKIKVETKIENLTFFGSGQKEVIHFYTKDKLVKKLTKKLQKAKDRAFAFETKCGAMEADIAKKNNIISEQEANIVGLESRNKTLRETIKEHQDSIKLIDSYAMKFSLDAAESRNEVLEKRNEESLSKISTLENLQNADKKRKARLIFLVDALYDNFKQKNTYINDLASMSVCNFIKWRRQVKKTPLTIKTLECIKTTLI